MVTPSEEFDCVAVSKIGEMCFARAWRLEWHYGHRNDLSFFLFTVIMIYYIYHIYDLQLVIIYLFAVDDKLASYV